VKGVRRQKYTFKKVINVVGVMTMLTNIVTGNYWSADGEGQEHQAWREGRRGEPGEA
jgi:hypothetical protein